MPMKERSAGRHAFNQIADIEEQGQTQAEKYERPPNSGAKALNEHSNPYDKRRIEPKNSPWKCHARAPLNSFPTLRPLIVYATDKAYPGSALARHLNRWCR